MEALRETPTFNQDFISRLLIPVDSHRRDFNSIRERQLLAQLDYLAAINFENAPRIAIAETFCKIVPASINRPLSSYESTLISSRFNFKDNPELRNNTVYFSKNKECCEAELRHAQKTLAEKQILYEYHIKADNILCLTRPESCAQIGVSSLGYMNEWRDLNRLYLIPAASQVFGSLARKNGFNGILYTSIRQQTSCNLVLFEENLGELDFPPSLAVAYHSSHDS